MKCRVLDEKGIECPSCGFVSQARTHKAILPKQLKQPYYFTKWFYCLNKECKTKTFMTEEFKVWNRNDKAQMIKNYEEINDQMNFIRNIT